MSGSRGDEAGFREIFQQRKRHDVVFRGATWWEEALFHLEGGKTDKVSYEKSEETLEKFLLFVLNSKCFLLFGCSTFQQIKSGLLTHLLTFRSPWWVS